MSNLVKKSHLQDVALNLWNRIKEKINETFKGASYDKTTQTITFTKANDATVDVLLTDLVSKTNANVITGETLITDGYILGGIISKLDNQETTMHAARGEHHWGHENAQVRVGQTLTHITIAIHNDVPVGTRIDGIKVGAINVSDRIISQYVIENATAYVQENKNTELTDCTRIVVVTLPQPFTPTQDSWFCVTCLNSAWGMRAEGGHGYGCTESTPMPAVGSSVNRKGSGYLGKYLLHYDKVSLYDIASAAKTVNGQAPSSSGDVALTASVDQTSINNIVLTVGNREFANLQCMTVQEAQAIVDALA